MALTGTLETEVELKCSADAFYQAWKKGHLVPGMTPSNLHGVKVHEGDWHVHGSILVWDYSIQGEKGEFKQKMHFDDANRSVTLEGIEGHVFKEVKKYVPRWTVYPKSNGTGSFAKLQIEYEKLNGNAPAPTRYIDFMITLTKDIDAGLVTKA